MKSLLVILNILLVLGIAFLAGLKKMIPLPNTGSLALFVVLTLLAPGMTIVALQEIGQRRKRRERKLVTLAMVFDGAYLIVLAYLIYGALTGFDEASFAIARSSLLTAVWVAIAAIPAASVIILPILSRSARSNRSA
jgi:Kef-type K+ transport system membrane component KefB